MNIYPDCDMIRWQVQCSSYIQNAENYYTKKEVDDLIDSATTSGNCCITPEEVDGKISSYTYSQQEIDEKIPSLSGYATEQWVENKGYINQIKTINNESLIGEGNITISGDCDLSDYVTFEDMAEYVGDVYTKTEVNNLFVTKATFNTYITNLQQQIDSLIASISGCCASSGETQYRWIIEVGENDYWCSGNTKMSMEKEQSSTDGLIWTDTGNERSGSTILELNCIECGYVPPVLGTKFNATYSNGTSYGKDCDGNATLISATTKPSGYDDTLMTSAVIGDCVQYLDYGVFDGCTSLTSVTIPNTVTSINNAAFYECESLPSIDLPSGLTAIDHYVFQDCYSLTSIDIPSGVTSIGAGAFAACNGLTSINIPDAVTEIRGGAFINCTSLSSVTIGTGITEIFIEAFKGCSGLSSITIEATVPPTLGSARDSFDDTNNCPIYVPSESVNDYKTSNYKGWTKYADRIQAIP